MPFKVLLTNDAARDLGELYGYIALHDAPRKADYVLEQIEKAFSKLSESAKRGVYPMENHHPAANGRRLTAACGR